MSDYRGFWQCFDHKFLCRGACVTAFELDLNPKQCCGFADHRFSIGQRQIGHFTGERKGQLKFDNCVL